MANVVKQYSDFLGQGVSFPIKSGTAITQGDFVSLDANGQVVQADKSTPIEAQGVAIFCDNFNPNPRTGVAALTVMCAIARRGLMSGQTALTIGGSTQGAVYLSTAGGVSQTRAATSGHADQAVGVAISATDYEWDCSAIGVAKFQTSGSSDVGHL